MQVKKSSSYVVGVARWVMGVALVFVAGSSFADKTYYVRPAESGEDMASGSGTEDDPYLHPQAAINAADPSELTTILLAEGTYPVWKVAYQTTTSTTKSYADEYRVIYINKDNIHIEPRNPSGEKPVLDAGKSPQLKYSRAIHIESGLEGVKISGLKTINGYTDTAFAFSKHTTCMIAYSGEIEDCLFVGYRRYRNHYILLSGPVTMRRCELTEDAKPVLSNSGGNGDVLSPLWVKDGALVDACYVHDCDFPKATTQAKLVDGHGICAQGEGTIVRNTIVSGIKNGAIGGTPGGQGCGGKGAGIVVDTGALVENCTVVNCQNRCDACGGIFVRGTGLVRNCIVWGNTGAVNSDTIRDIELDDGVSAEQVQYTDAQTGVKSGEYGNKVVPPGFLEDGVQIGTDSPLAGAGLVDQTWMTTAKDYYGNPRLYEGTVSMGAMEPQGRVIVLNIEPNIEGAAFGSVPFSATVNAEVSGVTGEPAYVWDFGDGTAPVTSPVIRTTHTYETPGYYTVTFKVIDDLGEHAAEKTLKFTAVGQACYVKPDSEGVPPYDTWEKATSNISAAVKLAPQIVWVTNGIYAVDFAEDDYGLKIYGATQLKSINGPEVTIIEGGYPLSASKLPRNLVRMTNVGAAVEGFTFRRTCPPMIYATAGRFENCVVCEPYCCFEILGNNITMFGGTVGVTNCVFDGAGMEMSSFSARSALVALEGAAAMDRCRVRNATFLCPNANASIHASVWLQGMSSMRNCFVTGMTVTNESATVSSNNWAVLAQDSSMVENCTITGSRMLCNRGAGLCVMGTPTVNNVISYDHIVQVDGVASKLDLFCDADSVVFDNNLVGVGALPQSAEKCITGRDPGFIDDGVGYRIARESPCFNAGKNLSWCDTRGKAKDIDGQERHRGRPDIGCYEVQLDLGLIILFK